MSTLDEEIAAIREAITLGVKVVETRTNGVVKRTEYPSFADLKARLDWLEGEKSALSGRRRRGILAAF
ncbi:phage head-tail joining protein [Brucella anthropi]|uniref:phage head-tail joining protein n=1 Tax=Brucella anthropi TaxID=529 RepID=UPI000F678BD8|nr:hypothetical protein [Brucella anthropi]RRY08813.1 hypothetical protein EGJ58_13000 [Brucella anthropi]